MKTNAHGTASLEPSTHAADLAQRVNVNEAKLTSELRPHYDFIVCASGSSGSAVARRLAEYNVLFDRVALRTIKTTPLDNGYVVIETAAI
jgi:hypothetical protein